MARTYESTPQAITPIETKYRKMGSIFPHPEAAKMIDEMRDHEPLSMTGQPPVIWDHAEGVNVYDKWGNKWLDMTSCVLVANAGHSNPEVRQAILDTVSQGILNSYCFPNEPRMRLVKLISDIAPDPLNRVFLLTTGSETTECAIKLARTYGLRKYGPHKIKIVTFDDAFHGRTMGAQQAGGSVKGKSWVVNLDPDIIQVPFPNAFKYEWADENSADYSDDRCFNMFLKSLADKNIDPKSIAGIMTETFQGGWVQLMPKGFLQRLRAFCNNNDIVLIFDEVQAGFGRTGKLFGFQHADIVPDLVCCGKGISSSLPISCVIGRDDIMNLYGPTEMTSTHTGNPVCSAAAYASINYILKNDLISNCARMGVILKKRVKELQKKYADVLMWTSCVGLVASLIVGNPNTKEINTDLAHDLVIAAVCKGVLLFTPVGAGATIKICPPLIIEEDAINEAFDVLDEVFAETLGH